MKRFAFFIFLICGCSQPYPDDWENCGKIEDAQFIGAFMPVNDRTQVKTEKGVFLLNGEHRVIKKGDMLFYSKSRNKFESVEK